MSFKKIVGGILGTAGPAAIAYWQLGSGVFPPRVINFDVTPAAVFPGEHVKLAWVVENADRVVIEPDLGSVKLSGSRSVQIKDTTTYVLTATNRWNTKVQQFTITPSKPPEPGVHISATPAAQLRGERITLTWSATDADSVVISGIGSVPQSGSREEIVEESRTYDLRATNRFGKVTTAQATVLMREWPTPTLTLWTEPNPVIKGRPATLRWDSSHAKSVTLDPFGSVNPSGSKEIDSSGPADITGTAEGPGGSRAVTLHVDPKEPRTISIAKNEEIAVRLTAALGSAINHPEDEFETALDKDLHAGPVLVAKKGSQVWGRVVRVNAPGRVHGRGAVQLVLERVRLVDGSVQRIETEPVMRDKSSTGKSIWRTAITTAAGAAAGAAIGGAGGAARGAATGGAASVAIDMAERGDHVILTRGTELRFRLRTALTVEIVQDR